VTANVAVRGLVKRFGTTVAVDGVDFDVQAGHFFTLLGPSGCGKTTTLRMIAGLEKPDAGEIRVGDRVVSAPERRVFVPPERRGMGMVFQSYAVWPHMTVFDNVAFPLVERRLPRREISERVAATLEQVGLGHLAKRPAPALSGGQQQRVALARALVANPEVLLLDEPLSNLDARLREQMRAEIHGMQRRLGITTIFVTHDQLEAMTLSDQVAVMRDGRIEQIGTPREVYEHPASKYVMDFIGNVNHLPARILVSGGALRARVDGGDLPLAYVDGWTDGEDAVLAFRSEAVALAPAGHPGDLRGTVTAATYLGGAVEYVVRIGASDIRFRCAPSEAVALGSTVLLSLSLADVSAWHARKPEAPRV
jgi:iron(III) transport system ATP-binding protein